MEHDIDLVDILRIPRELITSHRPLRLLLDISGGPRDDILLPQHMVGEESLCGGFEYRVLCVSTSACLPLKRLIGLPVTLEIVTDRRELRLVCGIVTEASAGDSDGGLAGYQIVMRDMLAILERRVNTRVFRCMNEIEIVLQILNEWRMSNPLLGTGFHCDVDAIITDRDYPKREFTMQHNESDAAFIRRLLARRGVAWFFRPQPRDEFPYHVMVLVGGPESLDENAAGTIRYHRDDATEQRDTITSWSAVRVLRPGRVGRHSWDYRMPLSPDFMCSEARTSARQG
ncbi:type VI secretion system Vgr family protein, partial [Oxalobacteraceae bacterium A2-2]